MSTRSKRASAELELALTVTSRFLIFSLSSPLLQLDKDKTSVGTVLASPRLADFSLQFLRASLLWKAAQETQAPASPILPRVNIRLSLSLCGDATPDAAGHEYVRVNQIKRNSFTIQALGVVYLGSARLGCRSDIVHPARSRSAHGSRRGRIGAGEKETQKKGAVGIGVGDLRQKVQTYNDMPTRWRFFEPRAGAFASKIAVGVRPAPASLADNLARYALVLTRPRPPPGPSAVYASWERRAVVMGEEMAWRARCASHAARPFVRRGAPRRRTWSSGGGYSGRSDVCAAPHALWHAACLVFKELAYPSFSSFLPSRAPT
ncbi:hypothetical protein B0H14DRAFT_3893862 [Mycena olivaceomarginata]|nr:hypothetical protein B0H14DRAFT_3893862 [Mycena olivaceomarginata]